MIHFFAGAPKHGSHFQLYIITEAMKQREISYEPIGVKIFDHNDSPAAKLLLDELAQKKNDNFVCKGHFIDKKLLMSYQDIRIYLIWRRIGDVLVSRFHYLQRRYGRNFENFADYYQRDGRRHVFYQRVYNLLWKPEKDERVFHVDYFRLRKNFQEAVKPMLAFAGLSGIETERLEDTVSIERSRKKHNDPKGILIRKGEVGEYRSVIPSEIQEDMKMIMSMPITQLKIKAFLNDPTVLFAPYYKFPGKGFVDWAVEKRKAFKVRKDEKPKSKKELMWWD